MQTHSFESVDTLDQALANFVADRLRAAIASRGKATLVVPGGRTPAGFLTLLGRLDLAWGKVTVTLSDDRCVSESSADSNAALLRRTLLAGHAGAASFVPLFNEAGATPEASAHLACEALRNLRDDFDVVVLGMGEDGHTASIFPDSPQRTQALAADAQDCVAVEASKPPPQRLTLSAARLQRSRTRILHITGDAKWSVLGTALAGSDCDALPVRIMLQGKADIHVFWTR